MNKPLLQLGTSVLALAGLLYGPASHATSLAELPLKASVLAKPNVIFGMDDSGSMDWEFLLDTDSGILWWNGTTAWNSATGKPLESDSSYTPYEYLFPVGEATGGQIYDYNSYYGQAVPPSNQFAWTRSHAFNPLYYDPSVTYPAWSKAYFDGSLKAAYPNATTTAASAHPAVSTAQTLNLTTTWNSSNANFSNNGFMFYMQAGMVVPSGSYVPASSTSSGACSGSTWRTLTQDVTVAAGRSCWAAVPYFPATYWEPDSSCTVGANCVMGPNGTTKLARREIKPANYTTTAAYNTAIQNFANWFSYYRKRKLMTAGSMGRALENVTGMRLGVVPFNDRNTVTMYDADGTNASSNRFVVSGKFYKNSMTANGTPTHATMQYIGDQVNSNSNIIQYACQRNSMFVVTDGFANTPSGVTVPSYTKSTYGGSSPYSTTYNGSLADLALAYYTRRARTDLAAGRVPTSDPAKVNPDLNDNLHVTTYAISLGVRGTLWPKLFPKSADYPSASDPFAVAPNWPSPVGDDPTMLDDLYHATLNGRGQMYLASNVVELSKAIQGAFDDILGQTATQGGSAVSTVNLNRSAGFSYAGRYNPASWTGDLTKQEINRDTGDINGALGWGGKSAGTVLLARDWTTRHIVAGNGTTGGVEFTAATVGATVNPNSALYTNADVVNYLRGDRSKESITELRKRTALLGPVVNSTPVIDGANGVIYLATGEGMLHAFNDATGEEEWAYVPYDALANIGATVERGYVFQTKLDATPVVAKSSPSTSILIGGMGAAGRSYYAIDVTGGAKGLSQADVASRAKWTFPRSSDTANRALMGYTTGTPVVARTANDGYVALVTSGYDNGQTIGDGKGRMWMLNVDTGVPIATFVTTEGTTAAEAGLSRLSALSEPDGTVRYVYGGDLLGNLWRFDLNSKTTVRVATLTDSAGTRQPITTAPELGRYGDKRLLMVGTGRVLDVGDLGTGGTQSFYVLSDTTDGTPIANVRTALVQHTYNSGTDALSTEGVNWDTKRGWYFDLPSGQKVNTNPILVYDIVSFVTNKNGGSDCSASSYLYSVDILTGGKSPIVSYVSTVLSTESNATGATPLRLKNGKLRLTGDLYDAARYQTPPIDPGGLAPSRNSWREVVR